MTKLNRIRAALKGFNRKEDGSQMVEAVLIIPIIMFLIMLSYTFFTAFDAKSRASKATDAVADYISRQTNAVDQAYVDGLGDLFEFLTHTNQAGLRVSALVNASQPDGSTALALQWSAAHGNFARLTDVSEVSDRVPLLSIGEQIIIVETNRPWYPLFDVGIGNVNFHNILPMKPRFSTQVVFDGPFTDTHEYVAVDVDPPAVEDLLAFDAYVEEDEDAEGGDVDVPTDGGATAPTSDG